MMWGFIPSGKRGCFDLKQIGAVNDVSHCFIKILLLRCNASECIDLIKIMMVAVDKNRLLLDISDSSVAAARKQYLISSLRVVKSLIFPWEVFIYYHLQISPVWCWSSFNLSI